MGDDLTPWQNVRQQARNGHLQLEPGVIDTLAFAAGSVMQRLLGVQGQVGTVSALTPFSSLGSGALLAEKFSRRGTALGDALAAHIDILNSMMEALIAAGRAYARAEDVSTESLDLLESRGLPTEPSDLALEVPRSEISSQVHQPDDRYRMVEAPMPNGQTQLMPEFVPPASVVSIADGSELPIGVENPASLGTADYMTMRASITPDAVAEAGRTWHWLANALDEKFTGFVNQLGIAEDNWQGAGRDAAVSAVLAYGTEVGNLLTCMRSVGDNLLFTTDALSLTRSSIVSSSGGGVTMEDTGDHAMSLFYGPGVKISDSSIPTVPMPTTLLSGINADGGGSPSGPGPGPGRLGDFPLGALPPGTDPAGLTLPVRQDGSLPGQVPGPGGTPGAQDPSTRPPSTTPAAADQLQQLTDQLGRGMSELQDAAGAGQGGMAPLPGMLGSGVAGTGSGNTPLGAKGAGIGGVPGGRPGPGPGPRGPGLGSNLDQSSKLFPRASATTGATAGLGRAGLAPTSGAPGSPGGMSPGGRGGGKDEEGHKRAKYLGSTEYLEESLGKGQIVSNPVMER